MPIQRSLNTKTEDGHNNNQVSEAGPKNAELTRSDSPIFSRNPSRVASATAISFANANANKQVSDENRQTVKQNASTSVTVDEVTRMDVHKINEQAGGETSIANAKATCDRYHWRNTNTTNSTRNDKNSAHSNHEINTNSRERAEDILAQTTGLLARLLRAVNNEDSVDSFLRTSKIGDRHWRIHYLLRRLISGRPRRTDNEHSYENTHFAGRHATRTDRIVDRACSDERQNSEPLDTHSGRICKSFRLQSKIRQIGGIQTTDRLRRHCCETEQNF